MIEELGRLENLAKEVSNELKKHNNIRIISHYDCDGIASAVIAAKGLSRTGVDPQVTFVKEINEKIVKDLKNLPEETFLFTDIGSGQLKAVEQITQKNIIISDHHELEKETNLTHLNPHKVGIDGGTMVSGAGVTYLLMKALNKKNTDLAHFAVIGAIGDIQTENNNLNGLNKFFLKEAKEQKKILSKQGLQLFGRTSRSLPLALAYNSEPLLKGIADSESGAVQFLSEIKIPLKENGKWRTLNDLSENEEKKIIHELIREGNDLAPILGEVNMLESGWEVGEFASVLNACGRLDKPQVGFEICVSEQYQKIGTIKREYSQKIARYLGLVNNGSIPLISKNNKYIMNAKDTIDENMIGTISSIFVRTLKADILIGMAHAQDNTIKISGRASNEFIEKFSSVNDLLKEVCKECEGEGGGHEKAAGGKIPRDQEDRFINVLRKVLKIE